MQDHSREQVKTELVETEGDIFFAIAMLTLSPCMISIGGVAAILLFGFSGFWSLLLLGIGISYLHFLLSFWFGLPSKWRLRGKLIKEIEAFGLYEQGFVQDPKIKKRNLYDIEDDLRQVENYNSRGRIIRNIMHLIFIVSLIRALSYPSETNILMIGIGVVFYFMAYGGIFLSYLDNGRRRDALKQELELFGDDAVESTIELSDMDADESYFEVGQKKKKKHEETDGDWE